jgi:hypothetical protein
MRTVIVVVFDDLRLLDGAGPVDGMTGVVTCWRCRDE